jgi:hypothetical protein
MSMRRSRLPASAIMSTARCGTISKRDLGSGDWSFAAPLHRWRRRALLWVRRIIRSAFRAKNREIVDLTVLGTHQDDTAFPASKINRVIARFQNWRGPDKAVVPWSGNGLKADLKA